MDCEVTEYDPPRRLAITWGTTGGVSFELEQKGDRVLLTLVHHRIADRATRLNISAGWHAHLDTLVLRMEGKEMPSFWQHWKALKADYDRRLPS